MLLCTPPIPLKIGLDPRRKVAGFFFYEVALQAVNVFADVVCRSNDISKVLLKIEFFIVCGA
ncbi:hypothetical protein D3C72_212710 [compost metagenome]